MRRTASVLIANAPGLYVGFLMGREHAWRAVVLNQDACTHASTLFDVQTLGLDNNDEYISDPVGIARPSCSAMFFETTWAP